MDSPWNKTHGLFMFEEIRYPPFDKVSSGWLGMGMNLSSSYIPMIGGGPRAVSHLYPSAQHDSQVRYE